MTDNKQKAKEEFAAIVKKNIDAMFDKDLSNEEVDQVILEEVGTVLDEVTTMNNIGSEKMEEAIDQVDKIKNIQNGIGDLKRIVEITEDLDKAA